MKHFKTFVTAVLSAAIVASTCGVLVFVMYMVFLPPAFRQEYWTLLAAFTIVDVCARVLLAGLLRSVTATAAAIAAGALFHLIAYTARWRRPFQAFTVGVTADAIVIMVMMTVAYVYAQKSRGAGEVEHDEAYSVAHTH